jgi:hypothetical protein
LLTFKSQKKDTRHKMKKIIGGFVLILLSTLSAIYIFIPQKLKISDSVSFQASRESVYPFLISEKNWQKWWPGTVSKINDSSLSFIYQNHSFQIYQALYNTVQIKIAGVSSSSDGLLNVIPYGSDSVGIGLETEIKSGSNPFKKVSRYLQARKMKRIFESVLLSIKAYTGNLKNVYGFEIRKEKVQLQHLVSTKQSFTQYPTTRDIYTMIEKLRTYLHKSGAKELFYPMLNIKLVGSNVYEVQVGLPVDRKLPEEGTISPKWMMKDGNILTTDVVGGEQKINEGLKQLEKYISDYQRSIIAIPFQMLITDRTKESDSSKWLTRLYYPVV